MARRRPVGRPRDPLALTEKILVRLLPKTKRALEKLALKNRRRLSTFARECLEDVLS